MMLTKHLLNLFLTALLLAAPLGIRAAEVGPSDLEGEDKVMFDKFRELVQTGSPDEFFAFAEKYEQDLRQKGYMMLYYKLLNNEGFFALRHNMVYRAMQVAERLDRELRDNKASDYYYLATGLMGDIYNTSHDRMRAERYFVQSLDEVGNRDPKFTMRTYQCLAEMLSVKDSQKALQWTNRAEALAQETSNVEYFSLSLAMKAYIHFLDGNREEFFTAYQRYVDLRSREQVGFNHRYDKVVDIAKLAFDGEFDAATNKLKQRGTLSVDSSLVALRIYAMTGAVDKGFEAMKRHYLELDSLYSIAQTANFDQMTAERALMASQQSAETNARRLKTLGLVSLVVVTVLLVIYVIGRRSLMSRIRKQNKELNLALTKAEESDKMKSAFISSMSHEIRTPLNAVSGFSQIICNPDIELGDEEKRDMQQRIHTNVQQITRIIDEVLAMSKNESEQSTTQLEKSRVAMNALGRASLRALKGRVKPGVKLRFATNVKDDFMLLTNEESLRSALGHLLDNATKFTDSGHIELRFVEMGNEMRIWVTDTGVGIKKEEQDIIFEKFAKGDDFKAGVGLGLPITHNLITALGGTLELDTSYEKGCRFMITLYID